jgi:hypothetical protein
MALNEEPSAPARSKWTQQEAHDHALRRGLLSFAARTHRVEFP